jgi:hypothetical protein
VSVVIPSLHFFCHAREGGHLVTANFGNNAGVTGLPGQSPAMTIARIA